MNLLITGASGSGTTKSLAELYGLPFYDADDYYWMPTHPPYRLKRDRMQRLSMIVHAVNGAQNGAVVAGCVVDWGIEIENAFTLIVFLTVPAEVRVERLKMREIAKLGSVDTDFLEWAAQYDDGHMPGRSLAIHEKWLAQRSCKILRIEGDVSVEEGRRRVRALIADSGEQPMRPRP